jgi:hypothetical protein
MNLIFVSVSRLPVGIATLSAMKRRGVSSYTCTAYYTPYLE